MIATKIQKKKEDIVAKTYREFRELKEKRTKCNYLKKLSNVKVKVERRGEVFSMEKYMEERGMKREEEDIKKKEKMMVMMMEPKNMGEEKIQHPKKKEPSSLEEEKDREMNSFLVKKNSRSVEGLQLKCFEKQVKILRKKNLLL